ncbi:CLUMA_CG006679, isoform A [Clunio marinus]|uniref:CLUMA_CG006679, isoform A n=1 Tax=Clunio marinus TaxID=568069 RepID=A0A1J1HY60_9DIPT|nr:CLUMA_CG006679, isoform A [Clunio marinus]
MLALTRDIRFQAQPQEGIIRRPNGVFNSYHQTTTSFHHFFNGLNYEQWRCKTLLLSPEITLTLIFHLLPLITFQQHFPLFNETVSNENVIQWGNEKIKDFNFAECRASRIEQTNRKIKEYLDDFISSFNQ